MKKDIKEQPQKISWKQDFVNNLIWYGIANVVNVWVSRPMFTGGEMSGGRTVIYVVTGLFWLMSFIAVTKLLAVKKGWLLAILITVPASFFVNFLVIQLFG